MGCADWRSRASTRSTYDGRDPYLLGGNAEAFLRALYLQLAMGARPPRSAPTCSSWWTR